MLEKDCVVQFNEKHKWCGCIGIIGEIKNGRIMVYVPIPEQGTACIFAKESELEYIGPATLVPSNEE